MRLRRYRTEDLPILARLFGETVRQVNCRDYTLPQVEAWAALFLVPKPYSSAFFTFTRHLWDIYSERSLLVTKVWLLYRPWWPESTP